MRSNANAIKLLCRFKIDLCKDKTSLEQLKARSVGSVEDISRTSEATEFKFKTKSCFTFEAPILRKTTTTAKYCFTHFTGASRIYEEICVLI